MELQLIDGRLVYSATDLVGFLECRHLANLERAAVEAHLARPMRADPVLDRIAQRGREHEARFLEELAAGDVAVVQIDAHDTFAAAERIARGRDATLEAMRAGADVIYQAVLFDGRQLGHADFLRRVEQPSDFGAWSYEVWDTKLARHAKASAVLQLCMYSSMLAELQGREPRRMHLALGGLQRATVPFRVADYAAYYRSVAREFEALLDAEGPVFPVASKPEPVEHCDVCRWSVECRAQWRAEDDLSLVANLTSRQRRALHGVGVTTRTTLAEPQAPLPERLEGIGRDALARVRAQAEIQVHGEREGRALAARIAPARDRDGALVPSSGLLMLPEPSEGDLFFDIEGDPFFGSDEVDGIDYLFGVVEPERLDAGGEPSFRAFWSIEGARSPQPRSGGRSRASSTWSQSGWTPTRECTSITTRRTRRPRSSDSPAATPRASRKWTGCCGAASSSTSTARCDRGSAPPWRATQSSGWSRSTASGARSICATRLRASSSSRPGWN